MNKPNLPKLGDTMDTPEIQVPNLGRPIFGQDKTPIDYNTELINQPEESSPPVAWDDITGKPTIPQHFVLGETVLSYSSGDQTITTNHGFIPDMIEVMGTSQNYSAAPCRSYSYFRRTYNGDSPEYVNLVSVYGYSYHPYDAAYSPTGFCQNLQTRDQMCHYGTRKFYTPHGALGNLYDVNGKTTQIVAYINVGGTGSNAGCHFVNLVSWDANSITLNGGNDTPGIDGTSWLLNIHLYKYGIT